MKRGPGVLAALGLALMGGGKADSLEEFAAEFRPKSKPGAKFKRAAPSAPSRRHLRSLDAYGTTYVHRPNGEIRRTSAKGLRPNAASKAERRAARERQLLAA